MENEISKKISNNGIEYTSKEFDFVCKEVRIKRELTLPDMGFLNERTSPLL